MGSQGGLIVNRFVVYKSSTTDSDGVTVVHFGLEPIVQPDLKLYTVTIDCLNNQAISYTNGMPVMTNTLDVPWIRIRETVLPWLCIGAQRHQGNLQPGDSYPNDCFHNGVLDDIRIYNRTLSASEVQSLYTGSQVRSRPPVLTGFHIGRAGP